ncbi:Uncharacterised protein [Corynebacterium kutscheri]|uniref:Uncharacterized protein n=1 Tax=Corynebacterium kutscheri TaxID=35755 RepID=A0A0F6QZ53_9CORY|nr:DUF5692 family protein [Corynebacterium kutscheri]AKE40525.1 hypothetical protein UL82_01485 [Corynebacterium kutscheri]VEH05029.1 Uncharacterised protein [Corynebacterium kutscheri]VEH10920.1 Uncharacterised protein [Corynebacterium kutscheri]VEH80604.1 Uncharacterised protein [Corynebacterium kutscheri]
MLPTIPAPDYPTLFFFERGDWWDYLMLIMVTAALATTAWLAQRSKWVVLLVFVISPLLLTLFWWPYSTEGTASSGWFAIVKQYSALAGSLCLVALQYTKKLRHNYWYLTIPPVILAVNIMEAVVRDFQVYSIHGFDPEQHMVIWGGPWNIINGIAGILNLLAISGWVGIFVAKGKSRAIIWGDLTFGWIIAYDVWNLSYCYNCLSDRAWYSGVALLLSCTIPVFFKFGQGSWIQFRAYTLTLWSAVVLTFPAFTESSIFAHRSAHNPTALLTLAVLSLALNIGVFGYHIYTIIRHRRNPFTQEIYSGSKNYTALIRQHASNKDQDRIAARLGSTPEALGYREPLANSIVYNN